MNFGALDVFFCIDAILALLIVERFSPFSDFGTVFA